MRFTDFKLTEASNLATGELVKYLGKAEDRVPLFLDKIQKRQPFEVIPAQQAKYGASVIIDPKELEKASAFLNTPGAKGALILNTEDGEQIRTGHLAKTGEFGSTGASKTGERKIANRGNTMEGVLGAATVARLSTRPGRDVTLADVKRIVDQFASTQKPDLTQKSGGGEITFPAKGNSFTDNFKLTVKLPMKNYVDYVDWDFMTADKEMAGYIKNCIAYVNEAKIVDRFAAFFENNKRADEVHVVADGVSDMTGRKTDIFMVYIDENGERAIQKFDLSLKAGTTPQFGQASAGGDMPNSTKKALGEYGWEAYKNIFSAFGVDVSSVGDQYLGSETLEQAVNVVYEKAYDQFKQELSGSDDDAEKKWLKTFINNVKEHGTYNDPNVQLLQFEKSKYYVLNFQRLDRLFEKDKLDLDVKLAYTNSKDGSKWPKLQFYNAVDGKILLVIRAKYSPSKMNNVIEKGPYLKQITRVRGN